MWEEKAVYPNETPGVIQEMDGRKIFEEIKFLNWSSDENKFVNVDKALLEELKVYEEFESLIISGKYMDVIQDFKEKRRETENSERQNLSGMLENNKKRVGSDEEMNRNLDSEELHQNRLNESRKVIDEPDIVLHPITSHDESLYSKDSNQPSLVEHQFLTPVNITTTASDKTLSSAFIEEEDSCDETSGSNLSLDLLATSMPTVTSNTSQNVIASGSGTQDPSTASDEDNVIQDLLEDIRGSFERQFDDEFNFDDRYLMRFNW